MAPSSSSDRSWPSNTSEESIVETVKAKKNGKMVHRFSKFFTTKFKRTHPRNESVSRSTTCHFSVRNSRWWKSNDFLTGIPQQQLETYWLQRCISGMDRNLMRAPTQEELKSIHETNQNYRVVEVDSSKLPPSNMALWKAKHPLRGLKSSVIRKTATTANRHSPVTNKFASPSKQLKRPSALKRICPSKCVQTELPYEIVVPHTVMKYPRLVTTAPRQITTEDRAIDPVNVKMKEHNVLICYPREIANTRTPVSRYYNKLPLSSDCIFCSRGSQFTPFTSISRRDGFIRKQVGLPEFSCSNENTASALSSYSDRRTSNITETVLLDKVRETIRKSLEKERKFLYYRRTDVGVNTEIIPYFEEPE